MGILFKEAAQRYFCDLFARQLPRAIGLLVFIIGISNIWNRKIAQGSSKALILFAAV
jgi:hypothetical protein